MGTGLASLDPNWFPERIQIYKDYTLKSLLNQTNRDFTLWMAFRPEDKFNQYVLGLGKYLSELKVKYFFTFDGLPYWDDKFNNDAWSRFKNSARIARECWRKRTGKHLLKAITTLFEDRNGTLEQRLKSMLPLTGLPYSSRPVFLTRIDSDDMIREDYIEQSRIANIANNGEMTTRVVVCGDGYIYNTKTQELCEYYPETNPPFHTIVFPSEVFFDAKRHLKAYGSFRSHEDIPKVFPNEELEDGLYCVNIHQPKNHISTVWDHPFRGKEIKGDDKQTILNRFGLCQ